MRSSLKVSFVALLGLLGACSKAPGARDWEAHPAVIEQELGGPLYAVSDIHGGYERLVALLLKHQIIQAAPATPDGVKWAAGPAVLVVTGDLFNKGPDGVGVIDLLRSLESSAAAAGGRVIVTLGNHEAEFLVDPRNDRAQSTDGIGPQLAALGISAEAMALGSEPRGRWLRERPFAARVGRFFFAHGGDTHGRTLDELSRLLRTGVDVHNYDDPEITGDASLLESSDWSTGDKTLGARYAQALGAAHIVFGHNPSGLGAKGETGMAQDGALFRIDCGMSPGVNYSEGEIFRVEVKDWAEIVSKLDADGSVHELWRGSLP